jgi:hypothetical protein
MNTSSEDNTGVQKLPQQWSCTIGYNKVPQLQGQIYHFSNGQTSTKSSATL